MMLNACFGGTNVETFKVSAVATSGAEAHTKIAAAVRSFSNFMFSSSNYLCARLPASV
jgi:hypothetical protein